MTGDASDPLKTPVNVTMVGRADPDVIKSAYHPKNRDWLLQKGGSSDKTDFVDEKLNAAETDREKRLAIAGDIQHHVLDQAYTIPFFEEPQAFATAPHVNGLEFEAVGRPSFYAPRPGHSPQIRSRSLQPRIIIDVHLFDALTLFAPNPHNFGALEISLLDAELAHGRARGGGDMRPVRVRHRRAGYAIIFACAETHRGG